MYVLTCPFALYSVYAFLIKLKLMPYLPCPLLSKQDQPSGGVEFRAEFQVGQCWGLSIFCRSRTFRGHHQSIRLDNWDISQTSIEKRMRTLPVPDCNRQKGKGPDLIKTKKMPTVWMRDGTRPVVWYRSLRPRKMASAAFWSSESA